jgi:calnexin
VDKKQASQGSLLTHMTPAILPSAEIDDVNDMKPMDWVDEEMIPDPEAVKPEDWDEEAPRMIEDPKAVKPDG